MPVRSKVLKPACSTLIEYVSGCTATRPKAPDSLVAASRVSFVLWLVRVILASGTALPDGSTTVPLMLPVIVICANIALDNMMDKRQPSGLEYLVADIYTPYIATLAVTPDW